MSFARELMPDVAAYYEGQGLTLKGPARAPWKTTACNFHNGSDSMRVNVKTGAFCCMSCGQSGGDVLAYHQRAHDLEFIDAAKALGAWVDDGAPARQTKPSPLSPRQGLELLAFESQIVAMVAAKIARREPVQADDSRRVLEAAGRIDFVRGLIC